MKILNLHSTEKIAGGERISFLIFEGLKNEFNFIFWLPKNTFINLKYYYPKNEKIFSIFKSFKEVLDKEKPKIVIAHGIRAAFYFKLFLLSNPSIKKFFRFLYVLHGIHFFYYRFPLNIFFILFEKLTNKLIDRLICVSRDDFELSQNLRLIDNKKIILIENGIDVNEIEKIEFDEFFKKRLAPNNELIILSITRFHSPKDIKTLIKAIKILEKENLKLILIGDGPERKELENLVKNLNLENKILFLGWRNREEALKVLKISEIFILSTKWEGLPLVVLESWAMRKPVIASDVHGIKCLIENNKNGLLFEFQNEKDLADKIKLLIENKELREKLGENGNILVRRKYNSKRMIEKYKNLFLEIGNEDSSSK